MINLLTVTSLISEVAKNISSIKVHFYTKGTTPLMKVIQKRYIKCQFNRTCKNVIRILHSLVYNGANKNLRLLLPRDTVLITSHHVL